jgi:hypothetical protein
MSDKPKTLAEVLAEHGVRVVDTPSGKRVPKPKEKK